MLWKLTQFRLHKTSYESIHTFKLNCVLFLECYLQFVPGGKKDYMYKHTVHLQKKISFKILGKTVLKNTIGFINWLQSPIESAGF